MNMYDQNDCIMGQGFSLPDELAELGRFHYDEFGHYGERGLLRWVPDYGADLEYLGSDPLGMVRRWRVSLRFGRKSWIVTLRREQSLFGWWLDVVTVVDEETGEEVPLRSFVL